MGFASQAETSLKNNRNLLKGRTSLKSRLSRWYGKTNHKPLYDELKEWKKNETERKKRLVLVTIMLIVAFTIISMILITKIL